MEQFALRKWEAADAESLAAAANNPRIAENLRNAFPSPYALADARRYIAGCIEAGDERQLMRAVVVGGRAAGSVSVVLQSDVYEKSAELGYFLAEEYWGRGIMTAAVKRICAEAFQAFDLVRIYAEVYEPNRASRRVLEKAGFTYEGTMRSGVYKNGKILSYRMYALLRGEES